MKVALLISGHIRTFVLKEQILFFSLFLNQIKQNHHCDVYLLLKIDDVYIQSNKGLHHLSILLNILNPVYSVAFTSFSKNNDVYYSQIKMIDMLIESSKDKYDYYIRTRPDLILFDTIYFNELKKDKIYTSFKTDAIGNDQFFIISNDLLHSWWLNKIRPTLEDEINYTKLPDYVIFDSVKENVIQLYNSGLVRYYGKITQWNPTEIHVPYWILNEDYPKLKYTIFVHKLKKIINVL
jgi:hypothetical protein